VNEKTKVCVHTYYVQNDVTIHVNRSVERKYKKDQQRTYDSHQAKPTPHDNSWKFKNANLAVTHAICNFSVIRIN